MRDIPSPRFAVSIAALLLTQLCCTAQRTDRVNAPYRNPKDPLFEILRLSHLGISLNRDSTSIARQGGGHLVLRFHKKKLVAIREYDKHGTPVGIGDFKDGTGTITLTEGRHRYEARLQDHRLNGEAGHWQRLGKQWYPRSTSNFVNGLLHGDSRTYSVFSPTALSVIAHYEDGYLVWAEGFGKVRIGHYLLFPLVSMIDRDFLCSRTVYEKGKIISHDCFVKKCRRCATY